MQKTVICSQSPFRTRYEFEVNSDEEIKKVNDVIHPHRKTVVVQGLGFVGAAMFAALSNTVDDQGNAKYTVIGVDLPDEKNYWKIGRVNEGLPPVVSTDRSLDKAFETAKQLKNSLATYGDYAYSKADIVVIDIHLDVQKNPEKTVFDYAFTYEQYKKSIKSVADKIKEETLVLVETTVPPGTTEKVILPLFREHFVARGLDPNKVLLAHSYERVMPGKNYLKSITQFYRVFSGINKKSKLLTREFLESFIDTKNYPLSELHSTTASEMAKVLENSYRAMNISFMQEWTEFAEAAEVNLFQVLTAIKKRPTHNNIMSPGFGVGGYCLTKDALLADSAFHTLFGQDGHLTMSLNAIEVNDKMPLHSFDLLKKEIGGNKDKTVSILGISYLNDVADTRYSPSFLFYRSCIDSGLSVTALHDPLVETWEETGLTINRDLSSLKSLKHDIVVFTVRHQCYLELTADEIVEKLPGVSVILDANNVLDDETAKALAKKGVKMIGVGKGHWESL